MRKIFKCPDLDLVNANEPFKMEEPDENGLMTFLVQEKNFKEKRVIDGIQKLRLNFQWKFIKFYNVLITII